ncbi:hypothetical protein [Bradyrhizobium sp. CSA112]|uniref:hypothetical protein n=1 Tax=Bradyrhizobium sp. CSA112 TaxID=2699170 RepID=UPI0023B0A092|nr:hypothetical protein [Bradyrhizobium sp. CSA112]
MMLDLGEQDGFKRRLARNPLLTRPTALQDFVVAIGEERLGNSIKHRLEKMQRAEAVIQEDATPRFEA